MLGINFPLARDAMNNKLAEKVPHLWRRVGSMNLLRENFKTVKSYWLGICRSVVLKYEVLDVLCVAVVGDTAVKVLLLPVD